MGSAEGLLEFIKYYSRLYYYENSKHVEDEIDRLLDKGIKERIDVVHIMAWKFGKIRHWDSDIKTKFVYHKSEKGDNGWKDDGEWQELDDDGWESAEVVTRNNADGNKFKLGKLANHLYKNRERLEKKAGSDKGAREILVELRDLGIDGLGPVYIVTLLYFLSSGIYPIYDQYAARGLKAIGEGDVPRKHISGHLKLLDENKNGDDIGNLILGKDGKEKTDYRKYIKEIDEIEKKIKDCGLKKRDLDRALWTYGHLFN